MRTDTAPKPTLLSDYAPYPFEISAVHLDVRLDPSKTRTTSTLNVSRRNEDGRDALILNGEDIDLISVSVDGVVLSRKDYRLTQSHLTLSSIPKSCEIQIETECAPDKNTQLMGLYVSGGRFCTQCEAEGFRRITYFPDRPDVLSTYTVRLEADRTAYPTLLANGNKIESGNIGAKAHYAIWHDPFPKPCYLFAMVAGEFDSIQDSFTTMSGRDIALDIFVDPGDAARAEYAMDALKRSMKWDEQAFGREYDLDRFMIVAVRDFNFGAMENKGLNIFNSALLLADGQSATDMNFERIESVVAHEYFHNWTGNRITCRDWFQLCLKEGFTVYRDQEFSAHERGAALQRIKDVKALRARQFPEDAGPLAHAVRPSAYHKIDNFYTATIYEKGAEIIRMLAALLGKDNFRKGCDLYFETLDGTAATVEQFIACFEEATGKDLSQFMTWYSQAGTPHLFVDTHFDPASGSYEVSFKQKTHPTAGQDTKAAQLMPISVALIDESGKNFGAQTFAFSSDQARIKVPNLTSAPALSVLRGFSAPVIVHREVSASETLALMSHDDDLFSRWEAGQGLARTLLGQLSTALQSGEVPDYNPALRGYVQALRKTLRDRNIDSGFKALALTPPTQGEILQSLEQSDPLAIYEASALLKTAIAEGCYEDLLETYHALSDSGPFSPDARCANRRALRNVCLSLLSSLGTFDVQSLAQAQFDTASNMTNELTALVTLMRMSESAGAQASTAFYDKWKASPLVLDKWFAVQASQSGKHGLDNIKALLDHADYTPKNPNRVRALIGGFAMNNPKHFHQASGAGYRFFTDQVLEMDKINPGIAARLLGAFEIWPKLETSRQALIRRSLIRIIDSKPSKNVLEIATRTYSASRQSRAKGNKA